MSQKFPAAILELISFLKKLPGVGTKTAERFAFEFLQWEKEILSQFGTTVATVKEKVGHCRECGCLKEKVECEFCQRTSHSLCIIASPRDVYAIEETGNFRGLYHVIEHLLSPLDGRHASGLKVDRICERIEKNQINEVILALDSTLEGDTTALYLKGAIAKEGLAISRLAFGIPMGSSLQYIDSSTLGRALQGRQNFV